MQRSECKEGARREGASREGAGASRERPAGKGPAGKSVQEECAGSGLQGRVCSAGRGASTVKYLC